MTTKYRVVRLDAGIKGRTTLDPYPTSRHWAVSRRPPPLATLKEARVSSDAERWLLTTGVPTEGARRRKRIVAASCLWASLAWSAALGPQQGLIGPLLSQPSWIQ
jgi:hypothetical protein